MDAVAPRSRATSLRHPGRAPRHRPCRPPGRGAVRRRRGRDPLRRQPADPPRHAPPPAVPPSRQATPALALLAMRPAEPGQYGRVIADGDYVERIVEWADATQAERAIGLCNAGVLCAAASDMARWLADVRRRQRQGRILPDRHRRPRPRRRRPGRRRSRQPSANSPASTLAPNSPPPRRPCKPGCAPPRSKPASP